jgi:Peptidase family M23
MASKAWYEYNDWNNFRQTYSWATYPVNGDDIPMPYGTPITALFPGIVTNSYCDGSGCTLIIKAMNPNDLHGIPYYYYAHLDSFSPSLAPGSYVAKGQFVGYSGGQNSGGQHPAGKQYSNGPHIMLGLSKSNSIPTTLAQLTQDLNPRWLLLYARGTPMPATSVPPAGQDPCQVNPNGIACAQQIAASKPTANQCSITNLPQCVNDTVNGVIGGIGNAIMQPIIDFLKQVGERIAIFLLALILIIVGIILLSSPPGEAAPVSVAKTGTRVVKARVQARRKRKQQERRATVSKTKEKPKAQPEIIAA